MVEFGGSMIEKREASTSTFKIIKMEGDGLVDRTEKIPKTEGNELVEAENSDATECSSSFDDSGSLDFHDDAESNLDSDGLVKLFNTRRRKLSSRWRSSIHPVMWRCKWIELQINMLEAQHKKYERKLEECKRRISTLEGDGTKSLTFEVRRKKRRRAEATNDIEAYMSNHNIFSYYDTILHPEKKKTTPRHCVLKNPVKIDYEFWGNDELVGSEDDREDEILEDILGKIKGLHSRVVEMRSRVGKVTGEEDNVGSPNSSSTTMCGMSMASYIASQLLSGSAVTTEHGEAVGSVNFTCEYDDDVLIDNHRVNDELCYLEFEEQVKKIHTIQRQTHELDSIRPPPHVATNDQTGGIELDRVKSSIRSVPNHATTSTKTTTSNKRPKREGRAQRV